MSETSAKIKEILTGFAGGSSAKESTNRLLVELGYESERVIDENPSVEEWIKLIRKAGGKDPEGDDTVDEALLKKEAKTVEFVLSFDDEDMQKRGGGLYGQKPLDFAMETPPQGGFLQADVKKFFFFAIALRGKKYTRAQYARLTRVISRHTSAPSVAMFFTPNNERMSIAFYERRVNMRNRERDVLGKVSVIREIETAEPHAAHLMILDDLRLSNCAERLKQENQKLNFNGLHKAWMDALDTEALNKRFYGELYDWFCRVVQEGRFPPKNAKPRDTRKATLAVKRNHAIRLIARLMFIWFIREKGMVAKELFSSGGVRGLLKTFNAPQDDSYYRVVLQNLFFATLNCKIEERGFSEEKKKNHRIPSYFRYRKQMKDPDALVSLFAKTPFVNGGLFDCLDSSKRAGVRVDCFSDVDYAMLSLPNDLFFDERGIFALFKRYKFTVEESTPVEQEVALDPELLGKVFENLLAFKDSNPEENKPKRQEKTKRKVTGSYYTPRNVVDYMTTEALATTLEAGAPAGKNDKSWKHELRLLLDDAIAYDEENPPFNEAEREALTRAISELKIMDPAVGSGAFPMAILRKLTLALRRIDPRNELWKKLQAEAATARARKVFNREPSAAERKKLLGEINESFDQYKDPDFGRKLYLIQNCIYGVDIQPTAIQIAKLRFFISLAIDQHDNQNAANFGFKPLPNLETKFVAANTLRGLPEVGDKISGLYSADALGVIGLLRDNRERHFHSNTYDDKKDCEKENLELRQALDVSLKGNADFSEENLKEQIKEIALWNPFDQMSFAGWFEMEYMYGIADGFDLVIGNPPYVRADSGARHLEMRNKIVATKEYKTLNNKWDLYVAFMEKGWQLLKEGGVMSYIIPSAYTSAKYAAISRRYFAENARVDRVNFLMDLEIFEAGVRNIIFQFSHACIDKHEPARLHCPKNFEEPKPLATGDQKLLGENIFRQELPQSIEFKNSVPWGYVFYVITGMELQANERTNRDAFKKEDLISCEWDEIHSKPYVEAKDIEAYAVKKRVRYLEWDTERCPGQVRSAKFPELFQSDKILMGSMTGGILDNTGLIVNHSIVVSARWVSLSGVHHGNINSAAAKIYKEGGPSANKRKILEEISRRFDIAYCLAILNSKFAKWCFDQIRRDEKSVYPEDIKRLPIADVPKERQKPIADLAKKIMQDKKAGRNTKEDQQKIDHLVYELYGLSPAQRKKIEGKKKKP